MIVGVTCWQSDHHVVTAQCPDFHREIECSTAVSKYVYKFALDLLSDNSPPKHKTEAPSSSKIFSLSIGFP